jgi:dihydrolipoamide dehydrogenase
VTTTRYDVIVLGSGSGGRGVADGLSEEGLKVAMVEEELVGGECPYWACMPAKALLRAAEAAGAARRVPGVAAEITDVDRVLAFRDRVASGRDDSRKADSYRAKGVALIRGRGRLDGPGRVVVDERVHLADHIVVATGSAPVVPPIDGLAASGYWTSRETMAMPRVPESVAVLGGGPVGVELGQALARLGAAVVIAEPAGRLLPGEEPGVGDLVGRRFEEEGIELALGAEVAEVRSEGAGRARVALEDGRSFAVDRIVVAAGRRPRVEGVGLETVGIDPDDSGVRVDARCRAAEGVWAVGDVTGAGQFTHVAAYQARVACADILGREVEADYSAVPRSVFSDPEVCAVGQTAEKAREAGVEAIAARVDLGGMERASTYGTGVEGCVGVLADRRAGVLVGAFGVGPLASEWMGMAVLAIRGRVPIAVLKDVIAQFPTFSEGLVAAVRELETA